ncbi:hypothetical protein [Mesorhizobium caraganae]|uniref:hypothetical protein n=1 Tax=Mesorhizobium caraganae TaxID=483206 RepID=UPI003ED08133
MTVINVLLEENWWAAFSETDTASTSAGNSVERRAFCVDLGSAMAKPLASTGVLDLWRHENGFTTRLYGASRCQQWSYSWPPCDGFCRVRRKRHAI